MKLEETQVRSSNKWRKKIKNEKAQLYGSMLNKPQK
jgi:hypothetical protein